MKVVVQRVSDASCMVDGKITGKIEKGLMLLVGFTHTDTIDNILKMAKKISGLRIFDDENGQMNLSIHDLSPNKGKILSISQFTLYADSSKGNRPSFVNCMPGDKAKVLYDKFNEILREEYQLDVEMGIFGSHMYLSPLCDGPVTILLEY